MYPADSPSLRGQVWLSEGTGWLVKPPNEARQQQGLGLDGSMATEQHNDTIQQSKQEPVVYEDVDASLQGAKGYIEEPPQQ